MLDLLPTVILMDIEIWLSSIKHRDNFKPVVLYINIMYRPILLEISPNLWTPYHNVGVFHWYNEVH